MSLLSLLDAEKVGIILAVLAFVVGLYHVFEIRRVMREAQGIWRSLSTRYLDTFPEYFEQIVDLLGKAKVNIVIFCDVPAYGSFSRRATWLEYHHKLERKLLRKPRSIEITCLDKDGRKESVEKQFFGDGTNWETLKQDADFVKSLQILLKEHPKAPRIADLSKTEFKDILESEEVRALEQLQNAKIREITAHMPLYFWLIDLDTPRAEAIFTIPSFSEEEVEYGFFTTDHNLIRALMEMRNRYHRDFSAGAAVSTDSHPE